MYYMSQSLNLLVFIQSFGQKPQVTLIKAQLYFSVCCLINIFCLSGALHLKVLVYFIYINFASENWVGNEIFRTISSNTEMQTFGQ